MFKEVSGIWPKGKVYTIICVWQSLDSTAQFALSDKRILVGKGRKIRVA